MPHLSQASGNLDEREAKRLRRKQSNRESARRSRLRKQAECEALARQVKELIQGALRCARWVGGWRPAMRSAAFDAPATGLGAPIRLALGLVAGMGWRAPGCWFGGRARQ